MTDKIKILDPCKCEIKAGQPVYQDSDTGVLFCECDKCKRRIISKEISFADYINTPGSVVNRVYGKIYD
jgi:hypothetical protein